MEKITWTIRLIKDIIRGFWYYRKYEDVDYNCLVERTKAVIRYSLECNDIDTCDAILSKKIYKNLQEQLKSLKSYVK